MTLRIKQQLRGVCRVIGDVDGQARTDAFHVELQDYPVIAALTKGGAMPKKARSRSAAAGGGSSGTAAETAVRVQSAAGAAALVGVGSAGGGRQRASAAQHVVAQDLVAVLGVVDDDDGERGAHLRQRDGVGGVRTSNSATSNEAKSMLIGVFLSGWSPHPVCGVEREPRRTRRFGVRSAAGAAEMVGGWVSWRRSRPSRWRPACRRPGSRRRPRCCRRR